MSRFGNQGLDHVAVAVSDMERSRSFYEGDLGLERAYPEWDMPIVLVAAGGTGVALFPESVHPSSTPNDVEPPAVRILHIAFRVNREGFDAARLELADARFSDHGLSHSLYVRDPDGHQIELTTYDV